MNRCLIEDILCIAGLVMLSAAPLRGAPAWCGHWVQSHSMLDPPVVVTIEQAGTSLRYKSAAEGLDYSVSMDGADHPIPGWRFAVAWKRIDARTWEEVEKANGRIVERILRKVSADAKQMIVDREAFGEMLHTVYSRDIVSDIVSGRSGDLFVGNWENTYEETLPQTGERLHIDCTSGSLRYYGRDGEVAWTGNFDAGKSETKKPLVAIRRTAVNAFQVTRSRSLAGKTLTETSTWTVAANGLSLQSKSGPVRLGPGRIVTTYVRIGRPPP